MVPFVYHCFAAETDWPWERVRLGRGVQNGSHCQWHFYNWDYSPCRHCNSQWNSSQVEAYG